MIVVIDCDMGNVNSIVNMIKKIGYKVIVSNNPDTVMKADKLILPGVGSFDYGMKKIKEFGLLDCIRNYAITEKKPLLGICLGMQLLGLSSEEGTEEGLSLINYKTIKFNFASMDSRHLKVPNMGWLDVNVVKQDSPISLSIDDKSRFYFVHSYFVPFSKDYTVLSSEYGLVFSAAVQINNIYGTQFHPEKSHVYGFKLLKSFLEV